MSLLAKIEKLEKLAESKAKSGARLDDPELIATIGRLIEEASAKAAAPLEPLDERIASLRAAIAELRQMIEHYKEPEPLPCGLESMDSMSWLHAKLALLESELSKLSRLS